ncbi:hypothetical protein QGX15_gp005 [Pseudomonas phage psageK4e]|uniref:Uncharacterized protein n=1 Tax=Pseudomonas phage psageK4e TaxID=2875723 RepID=A0AAE8XLN9_9CAUD|nr:hypothetical protein QGX15_gp005 [Pseudomonas phage psageK4e]UAW53453.1 hypothetical protein psageK4e_005c [Pseudomonas phage psageK4e]
MSHKLLGEEGLTGKLWELAYMAGPVGVINDQITQLRQQLESLKYECEHPLSLQKIQHHEFTQSWCVSTWTTHHCAGCDAIIRRTDDVSTTL